MRQGFFGTGRGAQKTPLPLVPKCGQCGLLKGCKSPKMPVFGGGRKGIMVVGEAPGKTEDERNRPFIGVSGERMRLGLRRAGIDMDEDCWLTNALRCRPPDNVVPKEVMVDYCRPNLTAAIKQCNPHTIILAGGRAIRSLLGPVWKENVGPVGQWAGYRIPMHSPNAWACPTFHPSYVLREEKNKLLDKLFDRHLKAAVAKKKAPWPTYGPPDFKNMVTVVLDTDQAVRGLREFVKRGKSVSFDYETDRLKPDHKDARIICASVSDGTTTIAYLWHGPAIAATRELLESDVPKVGYNLKFEMRWTRRLLGCAVKNFRHDGMLAAHVLDNNRKGVTSLKFQALIRLGQPDYASHLKPLMDADSGNLPNKLTTVNRQVLLEYVGLDSLLEHLVWDKQRKELGL